MTDRLDPHRLGGLVCQNPRMNVVVEPIQNQTTEELLRAAVVALAILEESRRARLGVLERAYWMLIDALAILPAAVAVVVFVLFVVGRI